MRAGLMLVTAMLLFTTACTAASEAPVADAKAPLDPRECVYDAIQELADAADREDLAYFTPLVHEGHEPTAQLMMRLVREKDVRHTYRTRMGRRAIPETATKLNVNYHGDGNFQIDLVREGDEWVVKSIWP